MERRAVGIAKSPAGDDVDRSRVFSRTRTPGSGKSAEYAQITQAAAAEDKLCAGGSAATAMTRSRRRPRPRRRRRPSRVGGIGKRGEFPDRYAARRGPAAAAELYPPADDSDSDWSDPRTARTRARGAVKKRPPGAGGIGDFARIFLEIYRVHYAAEVRLSWINNRGADLPTERAA